MDNYPRAVGTGYTYGLRSAANCDLRSVPFVEARLLAGEH